MKPSEVEIVKQYNALDGKEVSKADIKKLSEQAVSLCESPGSSSQLKTICAKLKSVIDQMNGHKSAVLSVAPIKIDVPKPKPKKKRSATSDSKPDKKDPAGTEQGEAAKGTEAVPSEVKRQKPKKAKKPAKKKSKVFAPTLSGFTRADQAPTKVSNTFTLKGEMGKFLGIQQRHKLVIALTGDYHGGKSEFVKQLIDAFADIDYTIGLFDLEQGGMASKDTVESLKRNVKKENWQKIAVTGEAEKGLQTVKEYADKFDVIVIDSGQKLGLTTNDWLDQLRTEFPETIFVVIFQQNAEGGVRGGAAADFDAPVALKAHRVDWTTYKKNYVSIKKNRGNRTDLRYMIADKKTVEEAETIKEEDNE